MNETRLPHEVMAYGVRFAIVRREVRRGVEVVVVRCPLCRRELDETSAYPHVEKHQARDAKSSAKDAARELGATAKPLPGQLGLDMGGGTLLVPHVERRS